VEELDPEGGCDCDCAGLVPVLVLISTRESVLVPAEVAGEEADS
jgi:hypothetical protein